MDPDTIDYAGAGEFLERFRRACETFDGDLLVALFTEDAEYHEDPFEPPLVGHNALRAYWLTAAESQDQVEVTIERHWTSGHTVLAAWHAGFVRRPRGDRVRLAGFMTFEMRDGRCYRFREWWHRRESPAPAG
ncbi:MAG TPA: nuclear transport factor 2 family protein [Candidatus Limnocylindrales bacterium]